MALPNFLILGAMKAGTTSLSDALSQHPDVFIPANKEPNSLVSEDVLDSERRAYEALFELGASALARGEASTAYTKRYMGGHEAARNARELLGADVRLIYLVRDPLARAASHARHTETARRPFDRNRPITPDDPVASVGFYAHQISPWLDQFGSSSLLVIDMADLTSDWPTSKRLICEHLGIDPSKGPTTLGQANASADARPATGLVADILSSTAYRRALQDRIPLKLRRWLRSLVVRRASPSTVTTQSLLVRHDTLQAWSDEVDRLEELTGVRCATPQLERRLAG